MSGRKQHGDNRLQELDDRAIELGSYIIAHEATVRSAAQAFGISKSTVHKDISVRLPVLHSGLYAQVRDIIEKNKQERHIRGGLATKRKYELQKQHPAAAVSAEENGGRSCRKMKKSAFPP